MLDEGKRLTVYYIVFYDKFRYTLALTAAQPIFIIGYLACFLALLPG
jgi:hypothetical protein